MPIIASTKQLFSMFFYLRVPVHLGRKLYFVAIVLCCVLILVACKRCSVNEVPNEVDIDTCRSYGGNFDKNYPDVLGEHASSEMLSRYSVWPNSFGNVCPPSNSFCFPSTVTGFLIDGEIDAELEALDDSGVHPEKFSTGLKQVRGNLSWPRGHSTFQSLDGRIISCTLQQGDGFELLSNDFDIKTGQQTDVSSCGRPVLDHKAHLSKSGENAETKNSGFLNGLSTPHVEIKPSLLDWGHKNMYDPSLACLTVKNIDHDGILSVYDPFSSNSQFYPCNFRETLLGPYDIVSICFVFLPTRLGLSSAQLILQTSFGGFLIQAKGFAVESPYLIKPLSGLGDSADGMWRKNFSLFNPFDEAFYVEVVTAWISLSLGTTSILSKAICSIHSMEDSSEYSTLPAKDWLDFESGEVGLPHISMRLHANWQVGPQTTETIVELNFSYPFEGKIIGALSLLLKSSRDKIDSIMVPIEAELSPLSAPDNGHVSASIETLVSCNNGSTIFALSVRNNAPYLLNVAEVREVGDGTETFLIKFVQGLVLFPSSVTLVAILNYTHLGAPDIDIPCKLLILINDTRNPQIEIPCLDIIRVSGRKLDSSVGYTQGINDIIFMNGREASSSGSIQPSSEVKAIDTCEADEFVLRNWKSQATVQFMSVLDDRELLFPMVHVGNYCSQWIAVKNPSQEPVLMQLILNTGEVIDKCRTSELLLQPSSSSIISGNKSVAPTSYGFSLSKEATTEAFIPPYGSAFFGPILFHPSHRCEWRSSALIRNNLSGVEWLSLRGFGGSRSLVFLVGSEPVQSLEFEPKLPTGLNFSSPEMHSMEESYSCSQPLTKEVYAKNTGDLSIEVIRMDVSGSECGLDGFLIHNCEGFSLRPGESVRLQISYQNDFSSTTIQRDLELALATGILVIPMKSSLPQYVFHFCKRSVFWMRVKKVMVGVFFVASLFFLICFFFPHLMVLTSQGIKNGKRSSSAVNGVEELVEEEEALVLESIGASSDAYTSCLGHENPSTKYQGKNILLDDQPEIILTSALSKSSVSKLDVRNVTESRNLRVIIAKEKGRRRKKKKSSGTALFELSSSQSGNSTPSSPLSPVVCMAPKILGSVSPGMDQSVENSNAFYRAPDKKHDNAECTEPPSKVNLLDLEVSPKPVENNLGLCAQEKPSLPRKVVRRAVLFPSATFPSAVRAAPPWSYHSPYLTSTSTIAPHARAPGSKLINQKAAELEDKTNYKEKMCVEGNGCVEEKFTYDIWVDHLFGLPFTYQSKQVSRKPNLVNENNSESFFVSGPLTLFTNPLLNPVSSDPEANE